MELTAREDIDAPLDRVFAAVSDFGALERQAMRRGIEVQRRGGAAGPETGMGWEVEFTFRGKIRKADITLSDLDAPERMVFDTVSGGLDIRMVMDLIALSRTRTRISVATELKPRTLSARLLVQSLKLAKGGLEKRYRTRMAGLAGDLETRLQGVA